MSALCHSFGANCVAFGRSPRTICHPVLISRPNSSSNRGGRAAWPVLHHLPWGQIFILKCSGKVLSDSAELRYGLTRPCKTRSPAGLRGCCLSPWQVTRTTKDSWPRKKLMPSRGSELLQLILLELHLPTADVLTSLPSIFTASLTASLLFERGDTLASEFHQQRTLMWVV